MCINVTNNNNSFTVTRRIIGFDIVILQVGMVIKITFLGGLLSHIKLEQILSQICSNL